MDVTKYLKSMNPTGSVITLDNIPPFYLPFAAKPELISDDWTAEFSHVTSPGSRYQYPIFKGCSPRTVSFKLRFDADYAGLSSEMYLSSCKNAKINIGEAGSLGEDVIYTAEMQAILAILEMLKLPKQGLATTIATAVGNFTKVQQGTNDPAPPLCLLMFNLSKMMMGYFSEIKITPTRRVKSMYVSRFDAECKFLVTPDYIFTTLEDVQRLAYALSSYYFIGANMSKKGSF